VNVFLRLVFPTQRKTFRVTADRQRSTRRSDRRYSSLSSVHSTRFSSVYNG